MNGKKWQSRSIGIASVLRGIRASGLARSVRRSKLFGGETGATLVETAFAYAILIPLLFSTIDFGYMFFTYQNVADASRRAARWAAVHGSSAGTACTAGNTTQYNCNATPGSSIVPTYVQDLGYAGVSFPSSDVTVSYLCATTTTSTTWATTAGTTCPSTSNDPSGPLNAPGNEVQVTVSYPFPLAIPYWKSLSINLSSTGTMVIQY